MLLPGKLIFVSKCGNPASLIDRTYMNYVFLAEDTYVTLRLEPSNVNNTVCLLCRLNMRAKQK